MHNDRMRTAEICLDSLLDAGPVVEDLLSRMAQHIRDGYSFIEGTHRWVRFRAHRRVYVLDASEPGEIVLKLETPTRTLGMFNFYYPVLRISYPLYEDRVYDRPMLAGAADPAYVTFAYLPKDTVAQELFRGLSPQIRAASSSGP